MSTFGFNINLSNTPDEIRTLGEKFLGTGLYKAIQVTYYEDMEDIDTFEYNQAIREIVTKYNPKVLVHISGFNLSEENSVLRGAILQEIKHCFQYVTQLGGTEVIIHTGSILGGLHVPITNSDGSFGGHEEMAKRSWQLSVKMMKQACLLAKEYNITLYTENLNNTALTQSGTDLVRFLDDVDCENLKVVFDIGHCHHTGHNIYQDINDIGLRLGHLHIHDNHGEKDEHASPGEGTIDFEEFVACLTKQNYKGLYMFELRKCDEVNLKHSHEFFTEIFNRVLS